jgi:hypothetical protein
MHPALAHIYYDHHFEYQFNQQLGTSSQQQSKTTKPSTETATAHLESVSDAFRDDLDYNKNMCNNARSFARRTHNIMPFFQSLLPTAPSPFKTTRPTSETIVNKRPCTDTNQSKNDDAR